MECAQCGTTNRPDARFCKDCGLALARRCGSCNADLEADQRYCDECGAPVDVAAAAPPPDEPAAVRKTVTVLFADLGGSTGFGERTDAEITRQVLARYHALLQATIDAHGGTVAKFMGDGMMATFGIPEVAEDDAERAVRAGIALQEQFAEFASDVAQRQSERLTLRVGINTGEVVIGDRDADLVGDALNVAARLEKACAPGHVLVGEATWRVTRGRLQYTSLGEVSVAGRSEPVRTFQVDASEPLAPEVVAPFVGRDDELARLDAVLSRAVASRSATLVTIVGAAGLGKTRLSREFTSAAREQRALTFEIRCDRAGGQTFAPVADLIRTAVGDDFAATDLEFADRERVVDVLMGIVGTAPTRSVEETFWGVRRFVEALAADQPVVLVVDDVQWAEPKLLDLLEHLVEWVHDAAVVIVALARPEIRDVRGALAEPGRRVADVLALDGLDSGATEALAAGLLGSALPRELVARLPQSTDGNPLFVRELVRMLVDDRVVERGEDGRWALAVDADAIDVPPSIQSLLGARVERLPADELRTLELASVIGAEFTVGALRALGAVGDDATVTAVLDRVRRRELVEPTGNYWGDEPVHRFHHVLIRDAVYRRLLKRTRADLHQLVGEWLAAQPERVSADDELAVAFHFEQAHQYRDDLGVRDADTDALGRSAASLLRAAAQRALDADDLASGGALARRALAVLPPADVRARLDLLHLGCECLVSAGDATAGAPLVDEFAAAAAAEPVEAAWAVCFEAQLTGFTDPGGLIAAERAVEGAANELRVLEDGAGQAKAHQVRALLLARLGRVGEAEGVLDQALAAARRVDDRRRVTAVLGAAPQAALFGPSPVARAGGRCLDVVRLLRITAASPSVEATSMRCQAVLEALRGRFDVARSMLDAARATVEELGLRHGLLETDLFAGMVELLAGNAEAAVAPLRAAYDGLGTLGVGVDAGQAAALLAHAYLDLGDTDAADQYATASEELAGQNLKTAIAWRVARARVLAARGQIADAVELAEHAVELAAGTDLTLDHADACAALAALRSQAGDDHGAQTARADALRLYEAKGATAPAAAGPEGPAASAPTDEGRRRADRSPAEAMLDTSAARVVRRSAEAEVIAVRGAHLVLVREEVESAPGLRVVEVDGAGDVVHTDAFEGADLQAALDCLEARHEALEGEQYSPLERAMTASSRLVRDGGFEAWSASLAPGFETHDWKPLGAGDQGDQATATLVGDLYERVPDLVIVDAARRLSAYAYLSLMRFTGTTAGGADYSPTQWAVFHYDNEYRLLRVDIFDEAQYDEALACFEGTGRWAQPGTTARDMAPGSRLDNLATRHMSELVASELVNGDLRVGARATRPLAIRGAHLAVNLVETLRANGESVPVVYLVETDPDGYAVRSEAFDEDDLDAAFDRLEDLYCAGEGREHALYVRMSRDGEYAFRRGDNEAVQANAAPDVVVRNHQPLSYAADTVDAVLDFEASLGSLGQRRRLICSNIEFRGNAGACWYDDYVTDASGAQTLTSVISVVHLSRGCQDVIEIFSADQEIEARARFDELAREPSHAPPDNRIVGNLAVLAWLRRFGSGSRLAKAAAELWADDAVLIDRRHGAPSEPIHGRDALIASVRATLDVFDDIREEPVAVRGERFALMHTTWVADGFESSMYALHEVDDEGRIVRTDFYDASDLETALAELDVRNYARFDATQAAAAHVGAALADATARFDLEQIRSLLAPDFVFVDHTPIGFGAGDADRYMTVFEPTRDQPSRTLLRTLDIIGSVVVTLNDQAIETSHGSDDFSRSQSALLQCTPDGQFRRMEWFPADQHASALRRAHELAAETSDARGSRVENAATARLRRWLELTDRRQYDEARRLMRPDFVRIDHRTHLAYPPIHSADDYLAWHAAAYEQFDSIAWKPIAVRGERLALNRIALEVDGGFASTFFMLSEFDGDDLVASSAIYDIADLDAAVADLDARYIAGEGAEYDGLVRRTAELHHALSVHDHDAMRAAMAANAVIVDHRPIGFGAVDVDEFLAFQSGFADVSGVAVVEWLQCGRGAVIASVRNYGTDATGGTVEWSWISVGAIDADERVRGADLYDEDDWRSARARFDELEAASRTDSRIPEADNDAIRGMAYVWDALSRGDEDAWSSVIVDPIVQIDRRRAIGDELVGRDAVIANLREAVAIGVQGVEVMPIAARGADLSLARVAMQFGNFESTVLQLNFPGGFVVFDADDLGRALAELDERYLEDEGRNCRGAALLAQTAAAWNRRDWVLFKATFAPAFVCVDHSPLAFPPATATQLVDEQFASLIDEVPNATMIVTAFYEHRATCLGSVRVSGHTDDGGAYEWLTAWVGRINADGLIQRYDVFQIDQWDEALALFDEFAFADDARDPRLDNAGMRYLHAAREFSSIPGKSVDEFADRWLSEDVTRIDRRSGISAPEVVGRDAYAAVFRAMRTAFNAFTIDPIAVRGERLALAGTIGSSPDGYELPYLILVEVDGDGRAQWLAHFDADDLPAALEELEDRYCAGEGAEHAYAVRRLGDFERAFRARDWDAFEQWIAPDVVSIDHRRIGFGTLDRAGVVDAFRSIVAAQPDHALIFHDVTVRGDVSMSFYSGTGTTTDGSTYEWPVYAVWQLRAGRAAVTDMFDIEDHAAARARFDELASADPRTPVVDSACVRVLERFWWLMTFDATDRIDEARDMLAPDIVQIDVRPGVSAPDLVGRDARLTNLAAVALTFERVDLDSYVAVRGEHLALLHWTLRARDFTVGGYDLNELDDDGRICRLTAFDESQFADAIAALEARHAELRVDRPGVAELGFRREKEAFERADWEAVATCYAPDFLAVDHRPLGFADATFDEYLARTRALVDRAPELASFARKSFFSDRAVLAVVAFSGTGPAGSEYEWDLCYVALADERGRYQRIEYFPLERWSEARARFDELSTGA